MYCDLIIVLGGDGTINDVISAVMESKICPKIAIIPNGTMNDLARNLGLPKNYERALQIINRGFSRKYNILKVNNTYATYALAIGKFCSTSFNTKQSLKKYLGKLAYFVTAIKEFSINNPIRLKVITNNKKIEGEYSLALICNSKFVAGFKVGEKSRKDTATLVLVKNASNFKNTTDIAKLFLTGIDKAKKCKDFEVLNFDKIKLILDKEFDVVIDGERYKFKELNIEVCSKQVDFVCNE